MELHEIAVEKVGISEWNIRRAREIQECNSKFETERIRTNTVSVVTLLDFMRF